MFSDFGMGIQQVHLAQGKDYSTMVVSWLTTYEAPTIVRYGTKLRKLDMTATSTDVVQYTAFNTTSGYIHHVPLRDLKPSTTYYYLIGETTNQDGSASIRYFTTLPKVGKRIKNFQLAVAADIGQTNDSLLTIDHLLQDPDPAMLLLAGDTSYADCDPQRWDTFFNFMQVGALSILWGKRTREHGQHSLSSGVHPH
jgi:phosphodiesterase/alkaline phosphatase D-like protein